MKFKSSLLFLLLAIFGVRETKGAVSPSILVEASVNPNKERGSIEFVRPGMNTQVEPDRPQSNVPLKSDPSTPREGDPSYSPNSDGTYQTDYNSNGNQYNPQGVEGGGQGNVGQNSYNDQNLGNVPSQNQNLPQWEPQYVPQVQQPVRPQVPQQPRQGATLPTQQYTPQAVNPVFPQGHPSNYQLKR